MDTVEDILAALTDEPKSNEPEGTDPDAENTAIKKVRDWGKEWERKARELEREVTELREFRTKTVETTRVNTAKAVFKELELPEEQANLYLKTHEGEVDADSIRRFVSEFKLKDLGPATPEDKGSDFEPGGPNAGRDPGVQTLSTEDVFDLLQNDPARAEQMFAEGRIKLPKLPGSDRT